MKISALLLALPASLLSLPALSAQELRPFTSRQGKTITAKFGGLQNGAVTLIPESGSPLTFPLEQLSQADQEYVKSRASIPGVQAASAADKITPEEMNTLAQMPVFDEKPVWIQPATKVAENLKLREESRTSRQSSYRSYPGESARLFGARPYSVALYAVGSNPSSISIVYANKGDSFGGNGIGEDHFDNKATDEKNPAKILKSAMDADLKAITETLTSKLGAPTAQRFGEGAGRRRVLRWDWRGQSILLTEVEGAYIGLQIETPAMADSGGKFKRTPEAEVKARVESQLVHRDNGDVVIGDFPMVDQGPKGYCVPATAERAMRHMDVPADMYILAMAGGSGFGGGTSINGVLDAVSKDLRSKGRASEQWGGEIKMRQISKMIDAGVPIIWTMHSSEGYNQRANDTTSRRAAVTDWKIWAEELAAQSKKSPLTEEKERGHACLIIGYNKATNEIAVSDSWGDSYKERWISIPDAEVISGKSFWAIGF